MNEVEKLRELIRKYPLGELDREDFIEQLKDIKMDEVDVTLKERDELGIRAQAAAERIRRL
jgi:hypothetical protein